MANTYIRYKNTDEAVTDWNFIVAFGNDPSMTQPQFAPCITVLTSSLPADFADEVGHGKYVINATQDGVVEDV